MFCTACAAPLSTDQPRCTACGRPVLDRAAAASSENAHAPSRRRYRRVRPNRLIIGLLYLVPLVGLLAGVSAFGLRAVAEHRSQVDAYRRAQSALAEGRLLDAQNLFVIAGDFRDASAQAGAIETSLRAYSQRYDDGVLALSGGDYDAAIELLLPVARELPDFREVGTLLEQARRGRSGQLLIEAEAAIQRRNWHEAERLYAKIAAENPDDPVILQTVRDFQRNHATFVYTFNHEIRSSTASGDEPALVSNTVAASWPVWSPDRSQIAFVSPGGQSNAYDRSLYVVQPDGTGLRKLADNPARWRAPLWSPDGRKIAFEIDGPGDGDPTGKTTIKVVDLTTGVVDDIIDGVFPGASSPAWSPTGDRIAFVVRAPARLGSNVSVPDETLRSNISEVYVKHLATGRFELIGDGLVPDPWRISWSPTSEEILVFSREDGTSFREGAIFKLNAVTGAFSPIDLASVEVSMPEWSPDGRHFAYVIRTNQIRTVADDGTERSFMTRVHLTGGLAWSPSADRLLALGTSGVGESLIVDLGSDGSNTSIINLVYDADGGDAGPPQWSPANPSTVSAFPSTAGTALDPDH
jgi:Tol biopolymer transport system component